VIAGADGCKDGWVVVSEERSGAVCFQKIPHLREIALRKELALIVVDIPMGLLDKGAREADTAARQQLGSRRSCVFTAPIRPILDCKTREEPSNKWFRIEEKKCTCQLWGIIPKIREVDELLRESPRTRKRIREGHPEVSFAVMNGGEPLLTRKRKKEGQLERIGLLKETFGDEVERLLNSIKARFHADLIDAFSMLWTARRISRNKECSRYPKTPEPDRYGIFPQIVA
jgi:predicted RNase H-like nuclease